MATKKKGRDSDTELKETGGEATDGSSDAAATAKSTAKSSSREAGGKVPDEKESKKESSKEKEGGGPVESIRESLIFLREVGVEFRKISWPSRRQVVQETTSVLVLVTIITLAVLAFDWGVGKFVFGPLGEWARHLGGGVGAG